MVIPPFLPPVGPTDMPMTGSGTPKPGTLSCVQILVCVNQCNRDTACVNGCVQGGTTTGRSQLSALLSCNEKNACKDEKCLEEKCGREFNACVGRSAVDAGSGPAVVAGAATDAGSKPDGGGDAGEALEPNPFLGRVMGGTRLKPLYANTTEGGKFFMFAFWDLELKTRCEFATAADGLIRCLPMPDLDVLTAFDEATCTNPLLPVHEACGMNYGIKRANGRISVFKLGPPAVPAAVYSVHPDASGVERCMPDKTRPTEPFYTMGAEVPATSFVAVSYRRPHILPNRRIHPLVHATTDGATERIGWYDSKQRYTCAIEVSGDGERRCLPGGIPMPSNRYSDASCTQLLGAVNWGSDIAMAPNVQLIRAFDASSCPTRINIHRSERVMPTMVYSRTSAGCQGVAPTPTNAYYTIKEATPATDWVKFTEVLEGAGRLKQRVLTADDGAIDRPSRPIDSMHQDQCFFAVAYDGKYRCLPFPNYRENFGDMTCTKRVSGAADTRCKDTGVISFQTNRWCAPATRVASVGAAVTTVFRKNEGGMCVAVNRTGQREVGADVAPTTYVEAKEMFE